MMRVNGSIDLQQTERSDLERSHSRFCSPLHSNNNRNKYMTTYAQSPARSASVTTVTTEMLASVDCRLQLCYRDEELRRRTQAKTLEVIHTAVNGRDNNSTNALLARKALKFRKLLHRVSAEDVADPSFDASRFLGVQWCKREGVSV